MFESKPNTPKLNLSLAFNGAGPLIYSREHFFILCVSGAGTRALAHNVACECGS